MSESLYEIVEQYRALQAIDPEGDENMVEAIANTLDAIDDDFESKVNAVAAYRRGVEARSNMFADEIARLSARKKAHDNQAESLKQYIIENMLKAEKQKIDSGLFRVTVTKPRDIAEITDATAIDDRFIKVTRTPNKAEILKALKAGEPVTGAELAQGKHGLRVA